MNEEIKEIEHIMICLKEHIALSNDEDTYLLDYITNLQQENERLKEWKEDLLKENIELENIRKEVIEYINNHPVDACHYLLNILQNGSDK